MTEIHFALMCRISLERPCKKGITATYTIFNREHVCCDTTEFVGIENMDGQTEVINIFQLSLEKF
jgi:hypothetical protein